MAFVIACSACRSLPFALGSTSDLMTTGARRVEYRADVVELPDQPADVAVAREQDGMATRQDRFQSLGDAFAKIVEPAKTRRAGAMTGTLRSGSVLSGETKVVLPDTRIVMMAFFFVSSLA
ncbi:MAG TPA: hypothetical protein VEK31_11600 [Xanthobacteraceae bacterium]|nr:hypothetical protein [Xanthobacteraceae bacterium]